MKTLEKIKYLILLNNFFPKNKIATENNIYVIKYDFKLIQKNKSGNKNKTWFILNLFLSKLNCWNNFITKITIRIWPALSVPNSASLLNDKLKNTKADKYKNFVISWLLLFKISLIKKKLKKIKKNIELKWKE